MAYPSVQYTFTRANVSDAFQMNENFSHIITALSTGTYDAWFNALKAASFTVTGLAGTGTRVLQATSAGTLSALTLGAANRILGVDSAGTGSEYKAVTVTSAGAVDGVTTLHATGRAAYGVALDTTTNFKVGGDLTTGLVRYGIHSQPEASVGPISTLVGARFLTSLTGSAGLSIDSYAIQIGSASYSAPNNVNSNVGIYFEDMTSGSLTNYLIRSAGAGQILIAGLAGTGNRLLYVTAAGLFSATSSTFPTSATLGDIIYGSAANVWSNLSGNTTTTKKFLTQTGDGVNSAAPGWNTIVTGDINSLTNTWANVQTFTSQPIFSTLTASLPVFTDGSKGLVSNAMTGTGSVMMSASPTTTGTFTGAAANFSGKVTLDTSVVIGNITETEVTTGDLLISGQALDFKIYGSMNVIRSYSAEGSFGSATATVSGRQLLILDAFGHDGTNYSSASVASLDFRSIEAFTSTNQGTEFLVKVTPAGSVTKASMLSVTTALSLFSSTANSFTGTLAVAATKKLYLDGGTNTYLHEVSGDKIEIVTGGTVGLYVDANQYVAIKATARFYLDGGSNTWIEESSGDVIGFVTNGGTRASFANSTATFFTAVDAQSTLAVTGVLTLSAVPRFNGTNTTGAGSALLGANCPASTVSAPYTWIQATSSDGSTVYIPVWK